MIVKVIIITVLLLAGVTRAQTRDCQSPCAGIDVCSSNSLVGSQGLVVQCTVSGGVRHVTISGVSVVNPQAGFLWIEATDNVSIGSVVIDAPSVTGQVASASSYHRARFGA
jgi:hypothetical protein